MEYVNASKWKHMASKIFTLASASACWEYGIYFKGWWQAIKMQRFVG